jgi:hypothetical protein
MAQPAQAALGGTIEDGIQSLAVVEAAVVDAASFHDDFALPNELEELWCIDHGAEMEAMSALAIRGALADGRLRPSQKVWRDGHACWQPISDFDELMPHDFAHEPTGRFEVPAQSGPRRIVRRAPAPPPPPPWVAGKSKTRAFFSAVCVGIVLGLLLLLPFASAGRLAPVLGAQARQILATFAP